VGAAKRGVRKQSYYDYSMLILIIFIVAFGLVMVYSASSYRAQISEKFNYDAAYFLKRQGFSALLGIVVMLAVSKFDYRLLIKPFRIFFNLKPVTVLYLLSIVLQILVFFVGSEINGAKRWIAIGGFSFQPSEITKISVILFTSYIIYMAPKTADSIAGMFRIFIYMGIPIILVMIENLSTAIILGMMLLGICIVASKKKYIYFGFASLIAGAFVIWLFVGDPFRLERFNIWLNVETHEKGAQILQGMFAIASGGMFGTGLGQSMQKLGFIPESHNDMIFTIICEELGIMGAIIVVAMFLMLIWRIFVVAISSPDLYGGLICSGVMIQIAVQVILNICVVTNTLPSTGVPLPFISYGGTSITILLAEMGLVLSVSNRIENR